MPNVTMEILAVPPPAPPAPVPPHEPEDGDASLQLVRFPFVALDYAERFVLAQPASAGSRLLCDAREPCWRLALGPSQPGGRGKRGAIAAVAAPPPLLVLGTPFLRAYLRWGIAREYASPVPAGLHLSLRPFRVSSVYDVGGLRIGLASTRLLQVRP